MENNFFRRCAMIVPFLIVGILLVWIMYCFFNVFYSQRIIQAIDEQDYQRLESICENPFGSVNSFPQTHVSAFWGTVVEESSKETPLHYACKKNDFDAVQILLKNGADPNKVPRFSVANEAPLISAAVHGNVEMMRVLIEAGADVGKYGRMALFYQMRYGIYDNDISAQIFRETVTLFEQFGLDIELKDANGENIFLESALFSNVEIAKFLVLEKGMDICETNNQGQTALHRVCKSGLIKSPTVEYVQFLLDKGVDPSVQDENGKTAYDYAIENGYSNIAVLLKPSV